MNYRRNDFIFCGAKNGKLSDLKEEEILTLWESFFEMVFIKECVLIDNYENVTDELENEKIENDE